jgi:hypothetical protein
VSNNAAIGEDAPAITYLEEYIAIYDDDAEQIAFDLLETLRGE